MMDTLFEYLKPYRFMLFLILILAISGVVLSLVDAILLGKMVNLATEYKTKLDSPNIMPAKIFFWDFRWEIENGRGTFSLGVVYIIMFSIGAAILYRLFKNLQDYLLRIVVQKFGAKIFTDGLRHSMKMPYEEFENQSSGQTLSILQSVRGNVESFMTNFINIFINILVGVIFIFIYATVNISWIVPLSYLVGIVIISFLTNFLSKKLRNVHQNIFNQTTTLSGSTTESLRNIEIIKSMGLTEEELDRLNKSFFEILQIEISKAKGIYAINFTQGSLFYCLRQFVLFVLMYCIFRNQMDAGQLVTMQVFTFLVFAPLQEIGNIIISFREAQVSLGKFNELRKKKTEVTIKDVVKFEEINRIEFKNVVFRHKSANFNAIDGVNFNIKEGQTIAFVGPSGAGKSTIMKLLLGLYLPKSGNIYYNGKNSSSIDLEVFRKQIGFVTQDTQLFTTSIRENLLFVNREATDAEIYSVLKKSSCENLILKSDSGLDTIIGEGGFKLSGGEKQRLSIARALLRNPKILIFDEATSSLDSLTEEDIASTIRSISSLRNQITIIIAHRLSTIKHADRIFVLEKGKIIEIGVHKSLLDKKGLYYAMWRQQTGERQTN